MSTDECSHVTASGHVPLVACCAGAVCIVYAVNACVLSDLPLSPSHSLPVVLSTALHNLHCPHRSTYKLVSGETLLPHPSPWSVNG